MWLRFIFIPNNRNWCSSRLSHTSSSCVCHCFFFLSPSFHPIYQRSHKTDRCETLCERKEKISTKKCVVKRAREMIRRIKESTTRYLYSEKKGGGSALQQMNRSERGRSSPVFFFYGPATWKQLHPTKISCVIKSIWKIIIKKRLTAQQKVRLSVYIATGCTRLCTHTHTLGVLEKGSIEWNETGQQFKGHFQPHLCVGCIFLLPSSGSSMKQVSCSEKRTRHPLLLLLNPPQKKPQTYTLWES